MSNETEEFDLLVDDARPFEVFVTLDFQESLILLEWSDARSNIPTAELRIRCTGFDELTWELSPGSRWQKSSLDPDSIRSRLNHFRRMYPTDRGMFQPGIKASGPSSPKSKPSRWEPIDLPARQSPWTWLENRIAEMAVALRAQFKPAGQSRGPVRSNHDRERAPPGDAPS